MDETINIRDYKFKIGDEVVTTEGVKGRISSICTCVKCRTRGFFEPTWIDDYGDCNYITVYQAKCGFKGFYKIGDYRFHDFDKASVYSDLSYCEKELRRLKQQLSLMEKLENGN